jgi:hypothetical protein
MNRGLGLARNAFSALSLVAGLGLFASGAFGQGGSREAAAFRGLAGGWSGSGTVKMASGAVERIRCRATYAVADAAESLDQNLMCASDSYRFEIKSAIKRQNKDLVGVWSEPNRNVTGNLIGSINGGSIDMQVDAGLFSALMTLVQTGTRQSLTIRPNGSDISEVMIAFTRSGT